MPRDFIFEDHECMANVRLAELTKAVEKVRLGKALLGTVLGVYGLEGDRDTAHRRHRLVVYRVTDQEPVCMVVIPDRGKPYLLQPPERDGEAWE